MASCISLASRLDARTPTQLSDALCESELETIVKRETPRLLLYLRNLCRSEDEADDLLQQIFTSFVEQVRKGRIARESAAAYLFRSARNAYIDESRRRKRTPRVYEHAELCANSLRYERANRSHIIRGILQDALNNPDLPAEISLILRLRFLRGADVSRIRAVTGKSQSTIYRLLKKGCGYLAETYKKEGIDPRDPDF